MCDSPQINCYQVESLEDSLFSQVWQSITTDWYGTRSNTPLLFTLASDSNGLGFGVRVKKKALQHPDDRRLKFVEGLWEYDVAELFISLGVHEYLECNLAPGGSYWAAKFSNYRKRTDWKPEVAPVVFSEVTDNYWQSGIIIPFTWDKALSEIKNLRLNVTAIFHTDSPCYLTFNRPVAVEPDFHLAALRQPITSKTG